MATRNTPTTQITSNGCKWHGESPDPIEKLIEVLGENTLDPRFEQCGDFVIPQEYGRVRFFGNFLGLSHVFNITTDDSEIIDQLTVAIRTNQASEEYQAAKRCPHSAAKSTSKNNAPKLLRLWRGGL